MISADAATALERLGAAASALQLPDPGAALEALLDAWRITRSPRVADLIDALTTRVTAALPPIVEPRRKRFHEAWLDLANARRSVDVGRLLEDWTTPPWSSLRERVDRLALRPDDPRIALALARFVEQMPTTNSAGDATWTAILRMITKAGDVRCRAPIAARLRAGGPGVFWEKLEPRLRKVQEALAAVTPIDPVEAVLAVVRARLTALGQGPALTEATLRRPRPTADAPNEQQLLQRIHDHPEDDAARLVYADFCAERGDPRGELIVLQFKAKPTQVEQRRIRDLLKAHGRAWLGPIEPAVLPSSEEFARGFLASCRIDFRTPAQREALLLHPAWNTLTRLWIWEDRDAAFLARHPLLGLEHLDGRVPVPLAAQMARRARPYPRLRRFMLSIEAADPAELASIGAGAAFPALTWLGLQGTGQREQLRLLETFGWLLNAPLMQRLEVLELAFLQVNLIEWLQRLRAFPKLTQLELGTWPSVSFFRDGDGWLARLRVTGQGDFGDQAQVLGPIAKEGLLTAVQAQGGDPSVRGRLAAALGGVRLIEASA